MYIHYDGTHEWLFGVCVGWGGGGGVVQRSPNGSQYQHRTDVMLGIE